MVDIVSPNLTLSPLEIVARLAKGTHPLFIPALDLLAELEQMRPIDSAELLRRGDEIETALEEIRHISGRSAKIVRRCFQLKPAPLPKVVAGF
jgi:hypothetical protein